VTSTQGAIYGASQPGVTNPAVSHFAATSRGTWTVSPGPCTCPSRLTYRLGNHASPTSVARPPVTSMGSPSATSSHAQTAGEVCHALAWPLAAPDFRGKTLLQTTDDNLFCFTINEALAPNGHNVADDPMNQAATGQWSPRNPRPEHPWVRPHRSCCTSCRRCDRDLSALTAPRPPVTDRP